MPGRYPVIQALHKEALVVSETNVCLRLDRYGDKLEKQEKNIKESIGSKFGFLILYGSRVEPSVSCREEVKGVFLFYNRG